MNIAKSIKNIQVFSEQVKGVFTLADIKAALQLRHPRTLYLRLKALEEEGILFRYVQGVYVTPGFDPAVLSQTICPRSYISFEYVLAKQLVIGSQSGKLLRGVKTGKKRRYAAPGVELCIEYCGVKEELFLGYENVAGVQYATAEKAVLDTLYFHLRGVKYNFDPYSDLDLTNLNREKLYGYLSKYRNPKFRSFVERFLHEHTVS